MPLDCQQRVFTDTEQQINHRLQLLSQDYQKVHRYLAPLICCIGVAANIAIVVVLLQKRMRTPINVFLVFVACCDMSLMTANFIYTVVVRNVDQCNRQFLQSLPWMIATVIYADLSVLAHSASLWLTVVMALVRCLVMKRINHGGRLDSCWFTAGVCVATLVLVCAGCGINLARNQISVYRIVASPQNPANCNITQNMTLYNLEPPYWWSCFIENINFWIAGVFFKLMPCILLFIFMTVLIKFVCDAKKRQTRLQISRSASSNILVTNRLPKTCSPNASMLSSGLQRFSSKNLLPGRLQRTSSKNSNLSFNRLQRTSSKNSNLSLNRLQRTSSKNSNLLAGSRLTKPNSLQRPSNQQHDRTTVLLILIVFVFLVTELPQGLLFIATPFDSLGLSVYQNLGDLLDFLSLVNNSINFILYCSMSQQFREEFVSVFSCCVPAFLSRKTEGAMTVPPRTKSSDLNNTIIRNETAVNTQPIEEATTSLRTIL